MCHLLRRMCRPLLSLKVRVRALQGSHLGWLLVLRLLGAVRVHDLVAELLQLLLQLKFRIGQVLVLLLRGWCAIVISIWARSSAHLRIWIRVI
jgi:hypothetical protein